jgi:hypothetical protein
MRRQKFNNYSVEYLGGKFYGINKFDCIVIDLKTTKHGGGYFTRMPISPAEYRKGCPTKASVMVSPGSVLTTFLITDDWGRLHTVRIKTKCQEEINKAIEYATEYGLMPKEQNPDK